MRKKIAKSLYQEARRLVPEGGSTLMMQEKPTTGPDGKKMKHFRLYWRGVRRVYQDLKKAYRERTLKWKPSF